MLNHFDMKMALPPFIPTLRSHSTGNHTRVDNMFCSSDLLDLVIKCHTDELSCLVRSDHYPIITVLDIHSPKAVHPPRLNFHGVDWPKLLTTLKENLDNILPPEQIMSIASFNHKLNDLNTAMWGIIDKHVKLSKPSPYSKRWWSTDLAKEK